MDFLIRVIQLRRRVARDRIRECERQVLADLHADVDEAPHWDEKSKTLLSVDLTAGAVFRYDELGVKVGSFSVGQEVGAAVPRHGGGLVLAVRDGIAVASDTGDGFKLAAPVERDTPGQPDERCEVRPCWATPGRDNGV